MHGKGNLVLYIYTEKVNSLQAGKQAGNILPPRTVPVAITSHEGVDGMV